MTDFQLYCGDVREAMVAMADNSIDAVFCDPPYGLGKTPDMTDLLHHWLSDVDYQFGKGFMGKDWDIVPGPAVWKELYRVAKPGAYLFAFGGTRTADLLSIAIRLAGWERFDEIAYYYSPDLVYGSGFPKSHNISKAIDRAAGAERAVVGKSNLHAGKLYRTEKGWNGNSLANCEDAVITAPATPEAATWAGYGSALKPAREPILCFRKPVDKTYAHNALTWGCGGLAIDACRVATNGERIPTFDVNKSDRWIDRDNVKVTRNGGSTLLGRWPANVIHDGSPAVMAEFDKAGERGSNVFVKGGPPRSKSAHIGQISGQPRTDAIMSYGDTGSAARFFAVCPPDNPPFVYSGKASRSERNAGVEDANHHPCVKPLSLCRYIASLILPPEAYRDTATILIPYAGSGSEVIGAMQAGWRNIIGIERDAEYCEIGRRRFAYWQARQTEKETLTVIAAESPALLREQGDTHANE